MKAPNLDWVNNLYEVGTPRETARHIRQQVEDAGKALAEAKAAHREAMREITRQAKNCERFVATLWTAAEIDAAKRGKMLIAGREIEMQEAA